MNFKTCCVTFWGGSRSFPSGIETGILSCISLCHCRSFNSSIMLLFFFHFICVVLLMLLVLSASAFRPPPPPWGDTDGGAHLKILRTPLKGTRILSHGCVLNSLPPLRGTNLTTTNYITGTANFNSSKDTGNF